jgi:hypothetical protein
MAKSDELLALSDLADRKGFDVAKARMRDHVRLIDPNGRLVVKESGGAVFSYAEARRYLEALPDRKA